MQFIFFLITVFPSKKKNVSPTNKEKQKEIAPSSYHHITSLPKKIKIIPFSKISAMETHLAKQLTALYKQTPSLSIHLPPSSSRMLPSKTLSRRISFRLVPITPTLCLTKSSPWTPSTSRALATHVRLRAEKIRRNENTSTRDPSLSGNTCRSPSTARGFRRR